MPLQIILNILILLFSICDPKIHKPNYTGRSTVSAVFYPNSHIVTYLDLTLSSILSSKISLLSKVWFLKLSPYRQRILIHWTRRVSHPKGY